MSKHSVPLNHDMVIRQWRQKPHNPLEHAYHVELRPEILEWLEANCKNRYHWNYHQGHVWFTEEEDAFMFKMACC